MSKTVWVLAVLLDVGEQGSLVGYVFEDEDKCFAIADFIEKNHSKDVMCFFQSNGNISQWIRCDKVVSMTVREANPDDSKEQKPVTSNLTVTQERAKVIN